MEAYEVRGTPQVHPQRPPEKKSNSLYSKQPYNFCSPPFPATVLHTDDSSHSSGRASESTFETETPISPVGLGKVTSSGTSCDTPTAPATTVTSRKPATAAAPVTDVDRDSATEASKPLLNLIKQPGDTGVGLTFIPESIPKATIPTIMDFLESISNIMNNKADREAGEVTLASCFSSQLAVSYPLTSTSLPANIYRSTAYIPGRDPEAISDFIKKMVMSSKRSPLLIPLTTPNFGRAVLKRKAQGSPYGELCLAETFQVEPSKTSADPLVFEVVTSTFVTSASESANEFILSVPSGRDAASAGVDGRVDGDGFFALLLTPINDDGVLVDYWFTVQCAPHLNSVLLERAETAARDFIEHHLSCMARLLVSCVGLTPLNDLSAMDGRVLALVATELFLNERNFSRLGLGVPSRDLASLPPLPSTAVKLRPPGRFTALFPSLFPPQSVSTGQSVSAFVLRFGSLFEFTLSNPWFLSFLVTLIDPSLTAPLYHEDGYRTAKDLLSEVAKHRALARTDNPERYALEQWVSTNPAMSLVISRHRWLPFFLEGLIAHVVSVRSVAGMRARFYSGSVLSFANFCSEMVMLYLLATSTDAIVQGLWSSLILAFIPYLLTQLLVCYIFHRNSKLDFVVNFFLSIIYFKTFLDSYRVIDNHLKISNNRRISDNNLMNLLSEVLWCKGAESITGIVSAMITGNIVLKHGPANPSLALAGLFSVIMSSASCGFCMTLVTYDKDLDNKSRRTMPEFYGMIPDNNSKRVWMFISMFVLSTTQMTMRVISICLLSTVSMTWVLTLHTTECLVLLLAKVYRNELLFHIPNLPFKYVISIFIRWLYIVNVGFTGMIKARHPVEFGGLAWILTLVWSQATTFAAAAFYLGGHEGAVGLHEGNDVDPFGERADAYIQSDILYLCITTLFVFWLVSLVMVLLLVKKEYLHTFLSTKSAPVFVQEIFLRASNDEQRSEIMYYTKDYWEAEIGDQVRHWLVENWKSWQISNPEWCTRDWEASIPDKMLVPVLGYGSAVHRAVEEDFAQKERVVDDTLLGEQDSRGEKKSLVEKLEDGLDRPAPSKLKNAEESRAISTSETTKLDAEKAEKMRANKKVGEKTQRELVGLLKHTNKPRKAKGVPPIQLVEQEGGGEVTRNSFWEE
jgi:hypothetical protein